jgi:hypothetical protein
MASAGTAYDGIGLNMAALRLVTPMVVIVVPSGSENCVLATPQYSHLSLLRSR